MGRYENRIRNFSPPERTFEYFASCKKVCTYDIYFYVALIFLGVIFNSSGAP